MSSSRESWWVRQGLGSFVIPVVTVATSVVDSLLGVSRLTAACPWYNGERSVVHIH